MKTKYSAKIEELLTNNIDEELFKAWLLEQPLIDQPDILREIQDTIKERLTEEEFATLPTESLAKNIDSFEDAILEIKLNQELDKVKKREIKEKIEEIADAYETLRAAIIASVLEGNGDPEGNKTLIREMIVIEKKFNQYDPENWRDVLRML
jgi:aromatic ring hydroxylase